MKIRTDRHVVLDLDENEVVLLRELLKALEDARPALSAPQKRLLDDLLLHVPGESR